MAAKKNKKTSRSARKGGGGRKKTSSRKAKKTKKVTKKVTSRSKNRAKKVTKKTTSRHRKSAARVAQGKRLAALMRARREGKAAFANLSPAEKARLRHARKHGKNARKAPHAHHATTHGHGQKMGFTPEHRARLEELRAKYAAQKAVEDREMARFA